VSCRMMPFFRSMRCWFLVMAGSLPVLAIFLPVSVFMMVDFPTFGMPRMMACIGFVLFFRWGNI